MATTNQFGSESGLRASNAISFAIENDGTPAAGVPEGAEGPADAERLRILARSESASWRVCSTRKRLPVLEAKWSAAERSVRRLWRIWLQASASKSKARRAGWWSNDSFALLKKTLRESNAAQHTAHNLPQVVDRQGRRVTRAYAAADSFLRSARYPFSKRSLLIFMNAIQERSPFTDAELWALRSYMQLALLESVGELAAWTHENKGNSTQTEEETSGAIAQSLQDLSENEWSVIVKELSAPDRFLCQDPSGAYARMTLEGRQEYRSVIAGLALGSAWQENEIAREVVRLAQGPHYGFYPRSCERRSHVGFYLVGEGRKQLKRSIRYTAPFAERIQETIQRWPNAFYFSVVALATAAVLAGVALFLGHFGVAAHPALTLAIFLIPALECAVATTNLFVTHLIRPQRLQRLDFSKGIPAECATLVAVPILLFSEKQVRQAVKDLEVRYLANRDPNLHFALVTDLPDSVEESDEHDGLAQFCSSLIHDLNEKYARRDTGSFFHLHRRRQFNTRERVWMGWERKRGKMLDLNNLILNKADHFPVKVGDPAVLHRVRYVITLDQDTQLPGEAAHKLIGALAHPLNLAVVDPSTNCVVEGYAILQPRVGISFMARSKSLLAAICSGDTGFDIYTGAISDVYQDLFGEAIYTGKGIYEVAVFQQVVEHRFPCNLILSHDLIEGAHARTGLISDVEVVDDYPSHVSAYSRRKHRWIRGDWQILLWLLPWVPDASGHFVRNPLRPMSRWKILDNLRRSISECAIFLQLLYAWVVLPSGAVYWTVAALALLLFPFLPGYLELLISIVRAGPRIFSRTFWKNTASDLAGQHAIFLFRMALVCHQSLVALDAVVRSMVRMVLTRKRLLEWESAAMSELRTGKRDPVEIYLDITPAAAIALAAVIGYLRPSALLVAAPFLLLWFLSRFISEWLSERRVTVARIGSPSDRTLLRQVALRTWQFFQKFSTAEENELIPDRFQQSPPLVVSKISPTNLGLLLNSQLAARDLGLLTLPEFVDSAEKTLGTAERMPKMNGHFYNWYDTRTLEPLPPKFVSTVDSGNLVCCLWTLKQACLEFKVRPLFDRSDWEGALACIEAIDERLEEGACAEPARRKVQELKQRIEMLATRRYAWWKDLPELVEDVLALEQGFRVKRFRREITEGIQELSARVQGLREMVQLFAPWLLPEFSEFGSQGLLGNGLKLPAADRISLESIPALVANLDRALNAKFDEGTIDEATRRLVRSFRNALDRSLSASRTTTERLDRLAATADRLAQDCDFSFLYNANRGLLSIGYDAEQQRVCDCHYDLLASEARAAVFIAIAKGDIPPESWRRLRRATVLRGNERLLLSWTGTLFEYLMPSLWMRSYKHTLLERGARAAIRAQKDFARNRSVPWGISESAYNHLEPDGQYSYRAFGLRDLALSPESCTDLVITPYAGCLGLMLDDANAVENLRDMKQRGWLGPYGYYEAVDFDSSRLSAAQDCEPVRCWMAHHQGMILVAVANSMRAFSMQRRFHAEPAVVAAERLLEERAPRTALVNEAPEIRLESTSHASPVFQKLWKRTLWVRVEELSLESRE